MRPALYSFLVGVAIMAVVGFLLAALPEPVLTSGGRGDVHPLRTAQQLHSAVGLPAVAYGRAYRAIPPTS